MPKRAAGYKSCGRTFYIFPKIFITHKSIVQFDDKTKKIIKKTVKTFKIRLTKCEHNDIIIIHNEDIITGQVLI